MNPFKFDLVPYTRGVGIEVGPDEGKTFPHFIKWSDEALHLLAPQSMDFAYYHTEEIDEQTSLSRIWRLVKQGGHLNIVAPRFTNCEALMASYPGWELWEKIVNEYWTYYAFKKINSKKMTIIPKPEGKTCAVMRYGGIGDMMLAANVFPELKAQGFHLTLFTHTNSFEVVEYDPFVDRFILQDSGQVPALEFRDFVLHHTKKYDRLINLSESIEGTLLSLPDRVSYYWPTGFRHSRQADNYYDITAKICEVPKALNGEFHFTQKEANKAFKQRRKLTSPVIMWVMSGSAVHKFWPYMDQAIARILVQHPTAQIVLVGDESSQILEQGWSNEPRVHTKCGKWSIRETMTFCHYADLIITPETGVAQCVAFKDVPKILLLSHSSVSNFAEDWTNCIPLEPEDCACYPCHQMHYGWEYCTSVEVTDEQDTEDPARLAQCQVNISVEQMTQAINTALGGAKEKAA